MLLICHGQFYYNCDQLSYSKIASKTAYQTFTFGKHSIFISPFFVNLSLANFEWKVLKISLKVLMRSHSIIAESFWSFEKDSTILRMLMEIFFFWKMKNWIWKKKNRSFFSIAVLIHLYFVYQHKLKQFYYSFKYINVIYYGFILIKISKL